MNNGLFSEQCKLERGVRQSNPLSLYLFVVAIDILGLSLRSNEHIEGIQIGNDEIKTLLHAGLLPWRAHPLYNHANSQQLDFEKCAGLKLNISKTKAMWIGASSRLEQVKFIKETFGP